MRSKGNACKAQLSDPEFLLDLSGTGAPKGERRDREGGTQAVRVNALKGVKPKRVSGLCNGWKHRWPTNGFERGAKP